MAEVVLRNENLPGQPVVWDVPVGGYVPQSLQDAGFVIDPNTSPDDARRENFATQEQAVTAAEEAAASWVPSFPPAPGEAEDAPPQGDPIDVTAANTPDSVDGVAAVEVPAENTNVNPPTDQPAEPVNTPQE